MIPQSALSGGYVELVSRYPLPIFTTQTWRVRTHPEAALKAHGYLMHLATSELFGKNYRRSGVLPLQWVAAIERHKSWNPHVHALCGHPDIDLAAAELGQFRAHMKAIANEEWGWSKFEVIKAQDDARSYVIDYAAKTGELFFSPHLEELSRGQICIRA